MNRNDTYLTLLGILPIYRAPPLLRQSIGCKRIGMNVGDIMRLATIAAVTTLAIIGTSSVAKAGSDAVSQAYRLTQSAITDYRMLTVSNPRVDFHQVQYGPLSCSANRLDLYDTWVTCTTKDRTMAIHASYGHGPLWVTSDQFQPFILVESPSGSVDVNPNVVHGPDQDTLAYQLGHVRPERVAGRDF